MTLETIMTWLTNPWFVGIVSGIPSGLIVAWLSRLLLGKRDDREYSQKIAGANRDVIYAVRPGISEDLIPTSEVLTSLLEATSRKYGVLSSDLFTPSQILEELIKEVMDSSFISAAKKSEYCTQLSELRKNMLTGTQAKEDKKEQKEQSAIFSQYRQRNISLMSMTAGIFTAAMTIAIAAQSVFLEKDPFNYIVKLFDFKIFIPALVALLAVSISALFFRKIFDIKMQLDKIRYQQEQFRNYKFHILNKWNTPYDISNN